MLLRITTPQRYDEHEVHWVELVTETGSRVIQPQHAPMILQLRPHSNIRFLLIAKEIEQTIPVIAGIAHITREDVTLLLQEE